MRYEYIKATSSEHMMHFSDQVHDLAMFNLKRTSKTDDKEIRSGDHPYSDKELYPMEHNLNSLSVGHHTVTSAQVHQATASGNSALLNMVSR